MFPTPYIPPILEKPEEDKSIFRNGLNIYMNGIYTGIGHAFSTAYNIGTIYSLTTGNLEGNLFEKIILGTLITLTCQSFNWVIHEMVSDDTQSNKRAKQQKVEYEEAIEKNNTNLVYKLEEEQPYLAKWGKQFIKNYEAVKPRQLQIPYENTF